MSIEPRGFQAQLLDWTEVHELPGGWPLPRLQALLERLEVDDVPESEALDMALMALQDLEPEDAADHVLHVQFGDTMRAGVQQNLAHELGDDRPWEEFADLAHQAGIFNAVVLLQQAFPRSFGKPDAVAIDVSLTTRSDTGRAWLEAPTVDAALLLRILAAGMDDRAILRRLFQESLDGPRFPEAPGLLWHVAREADTFHLLSSHQWFDALEDAGEWTVEAWPDA